MTAKIKSKNSNDIDVLLDKLKSIIILKPNNQVSFNSFDLLDLEWIFITIIDFGWNLNVESKKSILLKTFNKIAIDNDFSNENFLTQLNEQIKKHNNKQEKIYFLLAGISIENLPFRRIKVANSLITIHGKNFPKKFVSSRNALVLKYNSKYNEENYTKVSVKINARDFRDAYEQAFQDLEVFRSLLCLLLNTKTEIRFNDRSQKPINKVRHSEIFTMHEEDGKLPNESYYWFIPNYKEPDSEILLKDKKRQKLNSDLRLLIKRFNKCRLKHRQTIAKALNIYVSAFDESNKFICFLKSWTALETILDTDQNEILIKRSLARFDSKSKRYQKQIFKGLRQYRNEYVHEGNESLDPLSACYHTQFLLKLLILKFNLMYAGFFDNIVEANLFLDNYSPDIKEMKMRKKIIDRAIKLKEMNALS